MKRTILLFILFAVVAASAAMVAGRDAVNAVFVAIGALSRADPAPTINYARQKTSNISTSS